MKIYIPTVGRANTQHALQQLSPKLRKRTVLVVQHRERALYPGKEVLVLPPNIKTIAPTRQWIVNQHVGETLCMLDDDVREFGRRREDKPTLFHQCTDADMDEVFAQLEKALRTYAHAGILSREGADRVEEPYLLASRQVRVLAYHVPTLREVGVKFDRLPIREDFDVTLQLLRAGYPNFIIAKFMQGQSKSGASGGCATFRTDEMMTATALKLAQLHSPFVKVVEKQTKEAWGGGVRTDVSIQWKKAYAESGYTLVKPRRLA